MLIKQISRKWEYFDIKLTENIPIISKRPQAVIYSSATEHNRRKWNDWTNFIVVFKPKTSLLTNVFRLPRILQLLKSPVKLVIFNKFSN